MSIENTAPKPTHAELLALWSPYKTLARAMDAGYTMTIQWRERGQVPPHHWRKFIEALAEHHGVVVTMDDLGNAYPPRKPSSRTAA